MTASLQKMVFVGLLTFMLMSAVVIAGCLYASPPHFHPAVSRGHIQLVDTNQKCYIGEGYC
jgi:hypothetical protein